MLERPSNAGVSKIAAVATWMSVKERDSACEEKWQERQLYKPIGLHPGALVEMGNAMRQAG